MPAPGDPLPPVVQDPRAAADPEPDHDPSAPAFADAVAQLVRVGFGAVSVGLAAALRTLEVPDTHQRGPRLPVPDVADAVVGAAWGAARLSGKLAATGAVVAGPVVGLALWPPLVPRRLQPGHGLQLMVTRWQRDRPGTVRALEDWSAAALPGVVESVLARIDLTQLVLDRVDLERVVESALDCLDLTAVVVDQVDLGKVVAAALDRLDLTQVVLQQVDLIGVAEYVVEGIDLPEIIRESTGSVASEAVRGLRMQGVDADIAVARVVDRMMRRRRQRRVDAPQDPSQSDVPADSYAGTRT